MLLHPIECMSRVLTPIDHAWLVWGDGFEFFTTTPNRSAWITWPGVVGEYCLVACEDIVSVGVGNGEIVRLVA